MKKQNATVDLHVHFGQYYNIYYQPSTIIKCLHNNGIKEIWESSTTSCINWKNQEEKNQLLHDIETEIIEAVSTANKYAINFIPLYWVIPKRRLEGETIEDIVKNSPYKGFKIHPRCGEWSENTPFVRDLFEEVCICAEKYAMPILIHTGINFVDAPDRFEEFFLKYSGVKFVLAHCKDTDKIIDLFSKYNNVYGDTSFCPNESYNKICKYGFKDRMQTGTDFPIPHWIEERGNKSFVDEKELNLSYKKLNKQN